MALDERLGCLSSRAITENLNILMVNKSLKKEELKTIDSIRSIFELTNGEELSLGRAMDILKYTDLLLEIARGDFVCSKCGESQHLYEIRS